MGFSKDLVNVFSRLKNLMQLMLSFSSLLLAPQPWFSSLLMQKEELDLVLVQEEQRKLVQLPQAQLFQLAWLVQFLQAQRLMSQLAWIVPRAQH